jgi:hypothetical protein
MVSFLRKQLSKPERARLLSKHLCILLISMQTQHAQQRRHVLCRTTIPSGGKTSLMVASTEQEHKMPILS